MTLGKRIRAAREAKHYKQEYVAEQLGVSRQAVSKWETDTTEPDTKNLIALAALLDLSVDELLGISPVEQKAPPRLGELLFRIAVVFWVVSLVIWAIGFLSGCEFPILDFGSVGIGIWFLLFDTHGINLILTAAQWITLLLALILFVIACFIKE